MANLDLVYARERLRYRGHRAAKHQKKQGREAISDANDVGGTALCLIYRLDRYDKKDTTAVDAKMPNEGEGGIGCENAISATFAASDCGGGANSGGKQ